MFIGRPTSCHWLGLRVPRDKRRSCLFLSQLNPPSRGLFCWRGGWSFIYIYSIKVHLEEFWDYSLDKVGWNNKCKWTEKKEIPSMFCQSLKLLCCFKLHNHWDQISTSLWIGLPLMELIKMCIRWFLKSIWDIFEIYEISIVVQHLFDLILIDFLNEWFSALHFDRLVRLLSKSVLSCFRYLLWQKSKCFTIKNMLWIKH